MGRWFKIFLVLSYILIVSWNCGSQKASSETQQSNYGFFQFQHEVTLPGVPEKIYDLATGDLSEWWDHSFSKKPAKLYLEAKPGGGFWEIFDEKTGDGVLHATVIFAKRGEMLRFEGPLGLSGKAITMVTTYQFQPVGSDSTKFTVSVHAAGGVESGTKEVVESVWFHIIFEQFKPYVEARMRN